MLHTVDVYLSIMIEWNRDKLRFLDESTSNEMVGYQAISPHLLFRLNARGTRCTLCLSPQDAEAHQAIVGAPLRWPHPVFCSGDRWRRRPRRSPSQVLFQPRWRDTLTLSGTDGRHPKASGSFSLFDYLNCYIPTTADMSFYPLGAEPLGPVGTPSSRDTSHLLHITNHKGQPWFQCR